MIKEITSIYALLMRWKGRWCGSDDVLLSFYGLIVILKAFQFDFKIDIQNDNIAVLIQIIIVVIIP